MAQSPWKTINTQHAQSTFPKGLQYKCIGTRPHTHTIFWQSRCAPPSKVPPSRSTRAKPTLGSPFIPAPPCLGRGSWLLPSNSGAGKKANRSPKGTWGTRAEDASRNHARALQNPPPPANSKSKADHPRHRSRLSPLPSRLGLFPPLSGGPKSRALQITGGACAGGVGASSPDRPGQLSFALAGLALLRPPGQKGLPGPRALRSSRAQGRQAAPSQTDSSEALVPPRPLLFALLRASAAKQPARPPGRCPPLYFSRTSS